MVAMPGDRAVAAPVKELIEATPGLLLLHEPPDITLIYDKELPAQSDVDPEMEGGVEFTVMG